MKYITLTQLDHVGYVKLNRPEVRNAFHPEMISELTILFKQLSDEPQIRAVILYGEGSHFCAGADLNWMKDMAKYTMEQNIKDSENLFNMFASIRACSKPVIALAHGAVFGGALGLLACCDYVIADEQTQFCFSEVKIGLSPAVISHFIIPKIPLSLIGPLMISGQVFSALKAFQVGLVHDVVQESQTLENGKIIPHHQLHHRGLQFIEHIKISGPEAVAATKDLILKVGRLNEVEAKKVTTEIIAQRRVSTEGQEGLKSFFEKRKPNWILS